MEAFLGGPPIGVNDVHSRLNATEVARVVPVGDAADVRRALHEARVHDLPVAVAGARHAMGGQQFATGGLLLDMTPCADVVEFDRAAGTIEVGAGMQWPALHGILRREEARAPHGWAIRQKQTGADRLSLGGAVSANVHGRGLAFPPLVSDVEALTLVDARGEVVRLSRDENAELFRLVVGGYGLLGVVMSVRLRLVRRQTLERVVDVRSLHGLVDAFDLRIREGFLYGDFQFSIDPEDAAFLHRGVFSCYRPVGDVPVPAGQRVLTTADWKRLLLLAHTDKALAFERYAAHYLATSGQLYHSDAHQFADYVDDYHDWLDRVTGTPHPGSEMISELYVPRGRLEDFMAAVADDLRASGTSIVYGTIRLVERDDETLLAWARERWACVIFNFHVEHTDRGIAEAAAAFRGLIDRALERGGTYFLTYHRWATAAQLESAYPAFREFVARKREHDPHELFASDWYRHYAELT